LVDSTYCPSETRGHSDFVIQLAFISRRSTATDRFGIVTFVSLITLAPSTKTPTVGIFGGNLLDNDACAYSLGDDGDEDKLIDAPEV